MEGLLGGDDVVLKPLLPLPPRNGVGFRGGGGRGDKGVGAIGGGGLKLFELLLQMGIPVIFNVVVCSFWEV